MNYNISSIYQIRNIINNKIYIGSATNTRKRWNKHRHDLRKGIHRSRYLQNAWDKYGEENFIFEVLEEVKDKNDLITKEQYWLNKTKSYEKSYGYNICSIARSSLGVKRTEEFKKKISLIHKGKIISKETLRKMKETKILNGTLYRHKSGYKLSKEHGLNVSKTAILNGYHKGSKNSMAILNEDIVKLIICDLIKGMKNKDLCKKYSLNKGIISAINVRKTWKHITIEGFENVEIYNQVKKRRININ